MLFLHIPIYKKILTPLMKENLRVLCLVQQSNYQHQTLPIILKFECILCIISCFNNQTYALIMFTICLGSAPVRASRLVKLSIPQGFRDIFMIMKNCVLKQFSQVLSWKSMTIHNQPSSAVLSHSSSATYHWM